MATSSPLADLTFVPVGLELVRAKKLIEMALMFSKLKQGEGSNDGRFADVLGRDRNLIEGSLQFDDREYHKSQPSWNRSFIMASGYCFGRVRDLIVGNHS